MTLGLLLLLGTQPLPPPTREAVQAWLAAERAMGRDPSFGERFGKEAYRADLSGLDLRRVRFRGFHFMGVDLRRADLRDADLREAHLYLGDFDGADLRGADLRESCLDRCTMRGADLRGVRGLGSKRVPSTDADLSGVDLRDTDLQGGDLRRLNLKGARFAGADLRGGLVTGADLAGADLRGARVDGVLFFGARGLEDVAADLSARGALATREDLACAVAGGVDLTGADLSHADLSGLDLRGARLRGAWLHSVRAARADLSGADLAGAFLSYGDLIGARLQGADLEGAKLWSVAARGVDFRGASLAGAELAHADLQGADFSGARTEGADFNGALLNGVVAETPGAAGALVARAARWKVDLEARIEGFLRDAGPPLLGLMVPWLIFAGAAFRKASPARGVFVALTLGNAVLYAGPILLLACRTGWESGLQFPSRLWCDFWPLLALGSLAAGVFTAAVALYHLFVNLIWRRQLGRRVSLFYGLPSVLAVPLALYQVLQAFPSA